MCDNLMGFPLCYSLRISEYIVYLLLRPKMIGLIRSSEFFREEIVLKVIRRDIVIRFNSLTSAWTALSGFRSTVEPFFAQASLLCFQLARCTNFFVLSLIFSRTFWFAGTPLFFLGVST